MVDSARFRFVNRKLSNGVRSAVENGYGPPNQYQGSEENRGHAFGRVSDTSVRTALACRIHFYSDQQTREVASVSGARDAPAQGPTIAFGGMWDGHHSEVPFPFRKWRAESKGRPSGRPKETSLESKARALMSLPCFDQLQVHQKASESPVI